MDYEAFKKKIAEDVKQWLSACGYADVELNFWPVEKANFHYEALAVRMRKTNVGVNLNVESAYEVYKRTGAYTKTCEDLMVTLMRGFEDAPVVDSAAIRDYDIMKSKIAIEVISAEENVELLAKVPHERMEDLAVVKATMMAELLRLLQMNCWNCGKLITINLKRMRWSVFPKIVRQLFMI